MREEYIHWRAVWHTIQCTGELREVAVAVRANPGDEVIICDPGYVSYVPAVTMADGTLWFFR